MKVKMLELNADCVLDHVGTLALKNGKVVWTPGPKRSQYKNLYEFPILANYPPGAPGPGPKEWDVPKDPEKWLRFLPKVYRGTLLYAVLEED